MNNPYLNGDVDILRRVETGDIFPNVCNMFLTLVSSFIVITPNTNVNQGKWPHILHLNHSAILLDPIVYIYTRMYVCVHVCYSYDENLSIPLLENIYLEIFQWNMKIISLDMQTVQ